MRARITLLADAGAGVRETVRALGIGRATALRWRQFLRDSAGYPLAKRLSDASRPGTLPKFIREQSGELIALACEVPNDSGQPPTHWTYPALTDEAAKRPSGQAAKRRIVASISAHSVGRFLREADLKAYRTCGWINSPKDADTADAARACRE